MKFRVKRASLYDDTSPVPGAAKEVRPSETNERYNVIEWSIEISSLEELLAFVAREGKIILYKDNSIVIYDDYVE